MISIRRFGMYKTPSGIWYDTCPVTTEADSLNGCERKASYA